MCSGPIDGLMPHRLSDDVEEERRVFHVAITRGIQAVTILADAGRPSQFLDEMARPGSPPPARQRHHYPARRRHRYPPSRHRRRKTFSSGSRIGAGRPQRLATGPPTWYSPTRPSRRSRCDARRRWPTWAAVPASGRSSSTSTANSCWSWWPTECPLGCPAWSSSPSSQRTRPRWSTFSQRGPKGGSPGLLGIEIVELSPGPLSVGARDRPTARGAQRLSPRRQPDHAGRHGMRVRLCRHAARWSHRVHHPRDQLKPRGHRSSGQAGGGGAADAPGPHHPGLGRHRYRRARGPPPRAGPLYPDGALSRADRR